MSGDSEHPTYRVRQHYRYVYSGPIHDIRQRLLMIPPDRHGDQTLLSYDLEVRGTSGPLTIEWQTDPFGNRVCRVEASAVQHALDFEAWFIVRRAVPPGTVRVSDDERRHFLSFTGLTASNQSIVGVAQRIASQTTDPYQRASLAHDWAASAIEYQLGVTSHQTPAAMALHLGRGVCQDYAHILLSVLRVLRIPCRYVSGHLLGEGAPHAWVEVLLPDEVVAYDPTHRRQTTPNYITVAVGRDFADVTTTSGVFSGAATGRLHWSKQAERLDLSTSQEVNEAAA
jgi:transglutaminase-like putative cysteine protease